jgi:hypothetical protein
MMPLICPGCGGRLDVEPERKLVPFTCPYCTRRLEPQKNGQAIVLKAVSNAASSGQAVPSNPVDTAASLLQKSQEEGDPKKRYALLLDAEKADPINLNVQKALLLHGRWHERDRRKLDFSVIKCYLLHAFEEPKAHTAIQREQMVDELFHEERLKRAMDLAPDPRAFLREYLTALSQEYIRLFLKGSSKYMRPVFGFAPAGKPSKLLAAPAAGMIKSMLGDPLLMDEEQETLAHAFYDGFDLECEGETGHLDAALGADLALLKD